MACHELSIISGMSLSADEGMGTEVRVFICVEGAPQSRFVVSLI